MTTSDGQTGDHAGATPAREGGGAATPKRRPPNREAAVVDLATAAARPGVDPCDVACAAMPAQLLGDLVPPESRWLLDHTGGCRFCANELDRFERAGGALDAVLTRLPVGAPPPLALPPAAPRPRRAGYARLPSPVGPLYVAASAEGVCEIDFGDVHSEEAFRRRLEARGFAPQTVPEVCEEGPEWAILVDAAAQLSQYFGRRRRDFDLPLDFAGVSPFTRSVLEATAGVPFGGLDTYRGIAAKVGKPAATRAVGNALGRNPIPVVVPCHRVVRSGGALGGYTGGLAIKERLLALEGATLA